MRFALGYGPLADSGHPASAFRSFQHPRGGQLGAVNNAKFWKHELFRESSRLREAIDAEGIDRLLARRSPLIERFVFVTSYMMRKLDEARWLTVDVTRRGWQVQAFPCTSPPPHRRWFVTSPDGNQWSQPLDQHYDLDAPRRHTLSFGQVCDCIVHHFAFDARQDPVSGGAKLLFNSDWTKEDSLFGMLLDTYLELVLDVASDQVGWVDMDGSVGRVIQRRQRPPHR